MDTKHTPGPWYQVGAWVEHEDDDVADICSCDPATIGQEHLGRSDSEMCANAALIAAAPDMLAALLGFQQAWDENRLLTSDEAAAIRSAIDKATGGSA
jgi:hypothetical protein